MDEYNYYCPKCGKVFIEYLDILHIKDNEIGNRRSLENVDQDWGD